MACNLILENKKLFLFMLYTMFLCNFFSLPVNLHRNFDFSVAGKSANEKTERN